MSSSKPIATSPSRPSIRQLEEQLRSLAALDDTSEDVFREHMAAIEDGMDAARREQDNASLIDLMALHARVGELKKAKCGAGRPTPSISSPPVVLSTPKVEPNTKPRANPASTQPAPPRPLPRALE